MTPNAQQNTLGAIQGTAGAAAIAGGVTGVASTAAAIGLAAETGASIGTMASIGAFAGPIGLVLGGIGALVATFLGSGGSHWGQKQYNQDQQGWIQKFKGEFDWFFDRDNPSGKTLTGDVATYFNSIVLPAGNQIIQSNAYYFDTSGGDIHGIQKGNPENLSAHQWLVKVYNDYINAMSKKEEAASSAMTTATSTPTIAQNLLTSPSTVGEIGYLTANPAPQKNDITPAILAGLAGILVLFLFFKKRR